MMRTELIDGILAKWAPDGSLARVFERVRDIPYGVIGTRDPEQVYLRNMGTCSGKHFLFFELATALGFEARHFVCSHSFREFPVKLPPHLKKMLDEKDILDYHDFVKVLAGGRRLTVDLTWDLPLKNYGFPVNEGLDGKISGVPIETWETTDPEKFKEDRISSMPKLERERRKVFLQGLSDWVAELRLTSTFLAPICRRRGKTRP